MSNSHSGTIGRSRLSLTGSVGGGSGNNPIRRQHSVEWGHERKRGHLYGAATSSSDGGSSDDDVDHRLYGNTGGGEGTIGTGAVDNDFLATLIAQTQQLTSE